MPIPAYIYFIGFSLLIGLLNYRWLKPSRLHPFIPFLAITLMVELVGVYMKYVLDSSNGIIYNAYLFFQVLYLSWYYGTLPLPTLYKRIIKYLALVYILAALITYSCVASPHDFNRNLCLLAGFLVVLFGIFFLFNYFLLDNHSEEALFGPLIWITIGLIAYFSVLSITVSLIRYILHYDLRLGGTLLHNIVPRGMSIILYLSFAYSFYICRKTNQK